MHAVMILSSLQLLTLLEQSWKKAWKNPGLNGIPTHDLCDSGAVLDQLSYQAH